MKRICCIYKRIIFSNNEIVYRISSGSPAKKSNIFFEDFVEWSSEKTVEVVLSILLIL